jgi:hypothetical protein
MYLCLSLISLIPIQRYGTILRALLSLVFVISFINLSSQVIEDFEDGDITSMPNWEGELEFFQVINGQLNSYGNGSDQIHIATSNNLTGSVLWEFLVDIQRAPSNSNQVRVFLTSDIQDLEGAVNGYAIEIGQSGDDVIKLRRFDNGSPTTIFTGSTLFEGDVLVRIRVIRDILGNWSVLSDPTGGTSFIEEGDPIMDVEYSNWSYFGLYVSHTSTATQDYYFDDIIVEEVVVLDEDPPELLTVSSFTDQLTLRFNEPIEPSSLELFNIHLDQGAIIEEISLYDPQSVLLQCINLVNGDHYELSYSGIEDLSGNSIQVPMITSFRHLVLSKASWNDLQITEFLTDPSSEFGPSNDYIEIHNPTDHFFDLEGWSIADEVKTSDEFASRIVAPDEVVILTSNSSIEEFDIGIDVLGVGSFPNLNGSSTDKIRLFSAEQFLIDSISYDPIAFDGQSHEVVRYPVCPGFISIDTSAMGSTPGMLYEQDKLVLTDWFIDGNELYLQTSSAVDTTHKEVELILNGVTTLDLNWLDWKHAAINTAHFQDETQNSLELSDLITCDGAVIFDSISLYYDRQPPKSQVLILRSDNRIELVFHEPLDQKSAEAESNFFSDLEISVVELAGTDNKNVVVEFQGSMQIDSTYSIMLSGIKDTLNNELNPTTLEFTFLQDIESMDVLSDYLVEVIFSKSIDQSSIQPSSFEVSRNTEVDSIFYKPEEKNRLFLRFNSEISQNKDYNVYSVGLRDTSGTLLHTPEYGFIWDTKAPDIDEIYSLSDSTLLIRFSEEIDFISAINLNNYDFDLDLNLLEVVVCDSSSVRLLLDRQMPVEEKFYLWIQNIRDLEGNLMSRRRKTYVHDLRSPGLLSFSQQNDTTIQLVFSESIDTATLADFYFQVNGIHAHGYKPVEPNLEILVAYFSPISESMNNSMVLSGIQDQRGNRLIDTIQLTINTLYPNQVELTPLRKDQIRIGFSKAMDSTVFEPSSYEISDLEVNKVEPDSMFNHYLLTLDREMVVDSLYAVQISGVLSESGFPLQDSSFQVIFNSYIDEWDIIDPSIISIRFSTPIEWNLEMIDYSDLPLHSVYSGFDDQEEARFFFQGDIPPNEPFTMRWKTITDIYQRVVPSFEFSFIRDTKAPEMTMLTSHYDNQIRLHFDEPVYDESVGSIHQYEISPDVLIEHVEVIHDSVIVITTDSLQIGREYEMVIESISDVFLNTQLLDSVRFIFEPPEIPMAGDIRFTEIMFDPNPDKGLGGEEYIELYNTTDRSFIINSLILKDENTSVRLPEVEIRPNSYLVFSDSDINQNSVELSLFSLDNSGDDIILEDILGNQLDQVNYDNSWLEIDGASIELTSLDRSCHPSKYWVTSQDSLGGTPGEPNSLWDSQIDTIPPNVQNWEVVDASSLKITFNEEMSISSLSNIELYHTKESISSISIQDSLSVILSIANPFIHGIAHTFEITEVSDCSGNTISSTTLEAYVGKVPEFGDLIISEVMVDPEPSIGLPESEYIEIYNRSNQIISLSNVRITDEKDTSDYIMGVIQPNEFLHLISSNQRSNWNGQVKSLQNLPTLNNDGELISIISDDYILHQVDLSREMESLDAPSGGISLEIRNTEDFCNSIWLYSTADSGGTPGKENSVSQPREDSEKPSIQSGTVTDYESIELVFSEPLHPDHTGDLEVPYRIDSLVPSVREMDRFLLKLSDSIAFHNPFTMRLSDFRDCQGNEMEESFIQLVRPDAPGSHLKINEVLFNPKPGSVDFVELYNSSQEEYYILQDLIISNGSDSVYSNSDRIVNPDTYHVLCRD